ncbi:MAG: hypothetical protein ABEN55_15770 [Bradymonadaceae bacterium]
MSTNHCGDSGDAAGDLPPTRRKTNRSLSTTSLPSGVETMLNNSNNRRALRIMDHKGHFQLARICGSSVNSSDVLELEFDDLLDFRTGSEKVGLDPCSQQSSDVTYRAALLDAYWIHVRQDPNHPRNFQLVRHRIDAGKLAGDLATSSSSEQSWGGGKIKPSDYTLSNSSPAVIADRVVDFNIWFDCADDSGTSGAIDGVAWQHKWATPEGTGSTEPTNCLKPGDPDPARARTAHVRLSLRTSSEQSDLAHVPFQAGGERMQTYDVHPDAPGAARVVTAQMDFELPTFASRNIVNTSSP